MNGFKLSENGKKTITRLAVASGKPETEIIAYSILVAKLLYEKQLSGHMILITDRDGKVVSQLGEMFVYSE